MDRAQLRSGEKPASRGGLPAALPVYHAERTPESHTTRATPPRCHWAMESPTRPEAAGPDEASGTDSTIPLCTQLAEHLGGSHGCTFPAMLTRTRRSHLAVGTGGTGQRAPECPRIVRTPHAY